ncbi:tail fiber domain-containing protein [Salmonella enterica]|nr:tail fiber domain-containing protein [Salmonella enterica]
MPIDEKTPRLGLELPAQANTLKNDVNRLRDAITMLDGKVATIDDQGKVLADQLRGVVPLLGPKIDPKDLPDDLLRLKPGETTISRDLLPPELFPETFDIAQENLLTDLKAKVGDIANITGTTRIFELKDLPATNRDNWKESVQVAITKVNGQPLLASTFNGDLKVAEPGVNNNITHLTGLSGPLRLGGEAIDDNDAVTLRQLKSASGSSGSATMSGVMNNFIGAVEWFNGSRAKLPAGYIPADGQECSQGAPETRELYAAVAADFFAVTTEALWQNSGTVGKEFGNRGMYVKQSSPGKFRVPDLNGKQNGSVPAPFLRGSGDNLAQTKIGGVGATGLAAAPNITGTLIFHGGQDNGIGQTVFANTSGAFQRSGQQSGYVDGKTIRNTSAVSFSNLDLNASLSSGTYGRTDIDGKPTGEVRPNYVVGIWIIRANGAFAAGNTSFDIFSAPVTIPGQNRDVNGGTLRSRYQVSGYDVAVASFEAAGNTGTGSGATSTSKYNARIRIQTSLSGKTTIRDFTFGHDGTLRLPTLACYGNSVTKDIQQGAGKNQWFASGSVAASFCVFYPDGDSGAGFYIRNKENTGYDYILTGNIVDGTKTLYSLTPFHVDGTASSDYSGLYANAPFRCHAEDATLGVPEYQPGLAIRGQTASALYPNAVSFGKYTDGGGHFGHPCIVGGVAELSPTGTSANNLAWIFATSDFESKVPKATVTQGSILAPNGVIAPAASDIRIKRDIKDYAPENSVEKIAQIRFRTFVLKNDETNTVQRGVVAQELEKVDPLYVYKSPGHTGDEEVSDFHSLNSNLLLADALAAIQVLTKRVAELEAKLES